jgi:hypothetical protein
MDKPTEVGGKFRQQIAQQIGQRNVSFYERCLLTPHILTVKGMDKPTELGRKFYQQIAQHIEQWNGSFQDRCLLTPTELGRKFRRQIAQQIGSGMFPFKNVVSSHQ